MKKIITISILFSVILLSSCSSTKKENNTSNTVQNNDVVVNKVYEKIADDKVGLKNASQEDLDKILQEQVKINNTPTSKYPFFEQNTSIKGDMTKIIAAGGLEVTRGNIYLVGLGSDYSFLGDLLSTDEKNLSFNQNGSGFFFLDGDYKNFSNKLKVKFKDFKVNDDASNVMYGEFSNNSNKYLIEFFIGNGITRDDLDNILQTNQKTKVIISLEK